jgi:hypothetical protein
MRWLVFTADEDISELEDVPGLDDWLSGHENDDIDEDEIFNELEGAEFDELLESIDADSEDVALPVDEESDLVEDSQDSAPQPAPDDAEVSAPSMQLDNPDLDLEALLSDVAPTEAGSDDRVAPEDFLDVDALINDGDDTMILTLTMPSLI